MAYTTISINFNESTLCEEISFSQPGNVEYTLGSEIVLSDIRLSRNRTLIVMNVNYTEDEAGGLSTTVSGFSLEYKYTRKAPNCDISFFTMTQDEKKDYEDDDSIPDSEVFIKIGDDYGVGGWSMHSIVQKIAGWMGLIIINNLPDYWISDFSISLGSTFFEVLNSLISEFEPLIILESSTETLYVLERNAAGMLAGGGITPVGFTNRSVDGEYVAAPGCIKVEGGEGKYIAAKDPTVPQFVCATPPCVSYWVGVTPDDKIYSGRVETPDGSIELYSIVEDYEFTPEGYEILHSRTQTSKLFDAEGHESHTRTIINYEYDGERYILINTTETCEAEINAPSLPPSCKKWIMHNKISTAYEHDDDWMLMSQTTSRYELFIFDGTDYTSYNPQDYNLENLADGESSGLLVAEIRTTKYSEIDKETYGVETIVASKVWNTDDAEWVTSYTFEHDIVEAGSLQRNTRGVGKTLQVYAGDCPVFPSERYDESDELVVMDEPAKIFSLPTSDWANIEDCYVYLAALVAVQFQKASASVPVIDPLPLMGVNNLGNIIEDGIMGKYYIKSYAITIDPASGYKTDLALEARRSE